MSETVDEQVVVATEDIRFALTGGVEGLWLSIGMSAEDAKGASRVAGVRFDTWLAKHDTEVFGEGYDTGYGDGYHLGLGEGKGIA